MAGAVTYLAWREIKSNLRWMRVAPLVFLAMVACFLVVRKPWDSSMTHLQGTLSLFGKFWLPNMIPLVAAAMGSSLAADRHRGMTIAILARGVSRHQYLASKALGAMVSSGLVVLVEIIGFYLMAGVKWPTGTVTWEGTDRYPGPVPVLFAAAPLANDLLAAWMSIAAAATLSLIGVLAGTLVTNEYVAMAAPPLLVIMGALFLRGPLEVLSPLAYLDVWSAYASMVPVGLHPYAAFLYWLGLGVLVTGLSWSIFARRELS
jgi:hypothetical protein